MRKIVVSEFLSLDGVMEAPETWHFPFVTDDMQAVVTGGILASDAFLYGKATYDAFAGYWPTQTHNEFGFADKLNSAPKYVVSTTMEKADWNNTTVIKANVVEEVSKLKQQPGGSIAITGSGRLIRTLMQADLIDEYQLFVHPVVVGKGQRLFENGSALAALSLVDTKTFNGGVVLLCYQVNRTESK